MKKHLLYFFFFAMALSSCKKESTEPIIGDVDERLSEVLASYQDQLIDSEFGWKGYLLTDNETPATFLFKFNDKNRTVMSADYKPAEVESSYRLKALQRPTLMFDSYSTLHLIADPTSSVFGGETANGYFSDFEFAFLSANADTIKLEGTFNKSKLILIKSKSAEESNSVFTSLQEVSNTLSKLKTYFKRSTIGGIECEIKLDGLAQILAFSYLEGEVLKTVKSNYYVSGKNIALYEPLVIGSTTVSELKDINFVTNTGIINAVINDDPVQIKEAIEPMSYDKSAVERFWRDGRQLSFTPWVKDGISDYLNDASITAGTGLNQRVAWFGYGDGFDLIGYAASFQLRFGVAISSNINKTTGLIKYEYYGALGTLPPAYRNIILQTGLDFTDPKGLYVIETGINQYDLVSASDARKWLSFKPL
ncbi:DUF4302 domain-containing protein [Sphingobacterium sp. JUb56]|uniref:DUF4302 domain-containing protein n=1 Tax=Sphingobacterium sp. JUb56 TaxID=2587145 RepID=UPI0016225D1E|nr:DUF4302 domain-containing protein [Sphingobacterium sp. JUb56]MBB2953815.1 hypothetical protein [Sphingobacterium sp. JUb56]